MMLTQNNYPTRTHQPVYTQHLDVNSIDDIDSPETNDDFGANSIASSPHSTQSLLSQYSNNFQSTPLPTSFDSVPNLAIPRRGQQHNSNVNFKYPLSIQQNVNDGPLRAGNSQSLSQVPDLMPSEPWLFHSQQTPRAASAHRLGHYRESSLSSLGSNGPSSPYNANTSNPHIAVTDSISDGYQDLSGVESGYSYQMGKPMTMSENFYTTLQSLGAGQAGDASFADALPNMSGHQKPRVDRGLLSAPESSIGSSTKSHPVSVASSIASDSPATPSMQEPEDDRRRRKNVYNNSVPKLDRTMTDIYSDELYSPTFTITSASPPTQTHVAMSPSNDLFAQRIQAANSQHLSAVHSPASAGSRDRSPFRQGSPFASAVNDFSRVPSTQVRLGSAQQLRERRKAEQDAQALQQQMARNAAQQQGTPSTISPKDAMLEFNESEDGASNFPLFQARETSNFNLNQLNNGGVSQQPAQSYQSVSSTTPVQNGFNFSIPSNVQLPQQYPFVARPRQQRRTTPSVPTFSRVSSADTNTSDVSDSSGQKPARTNADSGTYTCTYHGCTQRFETPALLQKHKREGHRQANALNNARASPTASMTGSLLNSQAGPHRCDRINPSTGKPCNTVFSRPYDLTRHEDTIHNARKQKVRCNLCTEEKTFSRADALTRHYRVCHPDVEFPGKHRRRGGSSV